MMEDYFKCSDIMFNNQWKAYDRVSALIRSSEWVGSDIITNSKHMLLYPHPPTHSHITMIKKNSGPPSTPVDSYIIYSGNKSRVLIILSFYTHTHKAAHIVLTMQL